MGKRCEETGERLKQILKSHAMVPEAFSCDRVIVAATVTYSSHGRLVVWA